MSKYVIDIETTGLDKHSNIINVVGIADYSKLLTEQPELNKNYWQPKNMLQYRALHNKLNLTDNEVIFHNARFDVPFIEHRYKVKFKNIHDTKILVYLYDPREKSYGLKHWVKKLFNLEYDVDTEIKLGVSDEMLSYNLMDLQVTAMLYKYMVDKLSDREYILHNYLVKIDLMYQDIQNYGLVIDQDYLAVAHQEAKEELSNLDLRIRSQLVSDLGTDKFRMSTKNDTQDIYIQNCPEDYITKINGRNKKIKFKEFNIGSSQQLSYVLYDLLGYQVQHKTDKGVPSTGKNALKDMETELSQMILDFKVLNKQINAFFKPLGEVQRIHPSINITSTLSGRTSCKNPNLQQMPRGKTIRHAFKAPEGYYFVEMDYSQAELRCASHIAEIKNMLESYRQDIDLHTRTGQLIVGKEEITPEERTHAKIANFGILYGMVASTLKMTAKYAYGVNMSLEEAETIYNNFFLAYPELKKYGAGIKTEVIAKGYIENPIGRRLRMLNKGFDERSFNNAKIQGFASDILLLSMLEISEMPEHTEDFQMLGSVHDSILMYVKKDKIDIVYRLKEIMENPKYLRELMTEEMKVPIKADIDIYVDRWKGEEYE